ncbi:MAG TPA: hypothetical protein VLY23_04555 [Candidatus Acidoferrum sp.]|nr:hypothetical protein [Candidatus Acidoferrum sp.]
MNVRNPILRCVVLCCALAPLASVAWAGRAGGPSSGATITFRKVFKTSYPEFVEIKVTETGTGTYDIRQLDDDPNPRPLDLGAPLAQRIFQLAAELHDFQGVDLDVHRRIANLGRKTLRYEKGGEAHEVTFNYTLNDSAEQLVDIFEGISREETDLSDLQRTMKYDRLGVNDVLMRVEDDYNKKLLPDPPALLSTLDQIAADSKIIDIARDRARTLAGRIRNGH